MLNLISRACIVVAILGVVASQAVGLEAEWIGGPTGTWFDPINWSTGVIPTVATTNVTIDDNLLQESIVVLEQNATVGNLVIDSGDALNFNPGRVLIASSTTIGGNVNFAPSSRLQVGNSLWVQGGGELSLVDTAQVVDTTSPFYVLWNEGRIEGAGHISNTGQGAVLNNDGTVTANVPGKQLVMGLYGTASRGLHYNEGELIAENGGWLNLRGLGNPPDFFTALDNVNGVIEARGDSRMSLQTIRLIGGVLSTSSVGGNSEGRITAGSVMFENVTLEGNLELNSVTFSDRVTNNTDIQVSSFFVEGYATITGTGSMDLNGGSINVPGQNYGGIFVGTPGFINDLNHTIYGPGTINTSIGGSTERLSFDNRGLMETDHGVLQFNLRPVGQNTPNAQSSYNSGTIRAKTGGRVEVLASGNSAPYAEVLTNFSDDADGIIEAGTNSTVTLGSIRLRGGILRSVAPEAESTVQAGKIVTTGSAGTLLDNVRLEGAIGDANSKWGLFGEIENTHALAGQLTAFGPTTLQGGGEVQLITQFGGIAGATTSDTFHDPFVNEDNVIRGVGSVGNALAFVNRGIVQADVPNGQLRISPSNPSQPAQYPGYHHNSGVLQAINGGELSIEAAIVNYEGSDLGTIHAGDGSEVLISKITGGVLSTAGTGKIVVATVGSGNLYLADVHNQGSLVINANPQLLGRIVNDGTVTQQSNYKIYTGGPFTELAGNGTWGTTNIPLGFEIGFLSTGIFVHGEQHTLQGGGTINVARGTFVNRGTVISNGNSPLAIVLAAGTTMQQQGSLVVDNARTMEVQINDERFTNRGVIDAMGTFNLKRMNVGSVELRNAPGAELHVNSSFTVSSPITNGFSVTLWNQQGALMAGQGQVNLYRALANHETLLRNSGTLRPEGATDVFGDLFVSGNFQQDPSGTLEIQLGGAAATGDFDSLHVANGQAFLGGTLDIGLVNGYDPAIGDSFVILSNPGGEIVNVFDTFSTPALAGRWWSLDYQIDQVLLNVNAITADFDGNGFVDGDDLDDWQLAYQAGSAAADADGDGDSDGRDYLAWQQQYGSGVPLSGIMAVPEPSANILLLVFCFLTATRKR